MIDLNKSIYAPKAEALFREGYNCSQAVVLAFEDILSVHSNTLAFISSPFGGGMSRLREVCGCVSGMAMVLGLIEGYCDPKDKEAKDRLYAHMQELANAYKKETGSYICRELLKGVTDDNKPISEARTEEYYKKRPCPKLCAIAAAIVEERLELHE